MTKGYHNYRGRGRKRRQQIALAVVIEKGGSGGALASTAVQILNAYFTSVDEAKAVVGENMLIQ